MILAHDVIDVGGITIEAQPSANILLHVVAVWQVAAEGQSDSTVSDMEVHMEQMGVTEFLHMEKFLSTDIHWCLLNLMETKQWTRAQWGDVWWNTLRQ